MEETFKKLSELIGKGGRVEESEKSIKRKKEKFFLDMISILCEIEAYQKISESVGISLVKYEDLHFQIIEGLLEKQYGELIKMTMPSKSEIVKYWQNFTSLLAIKELDRYPSMWIAPILWRRRVSIMLSSFMPWSQCSPIKE